MFENVNSLRHLHLEDKAGFILLAVIMRLLDPKTRESFDNLKTEVNRLPKLVDFIHQHLSSNRTLHNDHTARKLNENKTRDQTNSLCSRAAKISEICPVCNQHHHLMYKCQQFQSMEVAQRINLTKELCIYKLPFIDTFFESM